MSSEGAPATSNLDGKRKRREKNWYTKRGNRGRGRGGRKGPRRESNFNPRTNFRSKGRGGKIVQSALSLICLRRNASDVKAYYESDTTKS